MIFLDSTGYIKTRCVRNKEEESTEYYCGIFCPCFISEDTEQTLRQILEDQVAFPKASLEEILKKYCTSLGSTPGIMLLEKIDWTHMKLTKFTTARRLI